MAASSLLFPLAVRGPAKYHIKARENTQGLIIRCSSLRHDSEASLVDGHRLNAINRRKLIGLCLGLSCLILDSNNAKAAGLPPEQNPKLCDDACEKELENVPMVTTESGLQYKDIKVGQGPSPPVGFQVAANYVAMVPSGQIFDSSLEKGLPYIFRVGSGQVVKGLDERNPYHESWWKTPTLHSRIIGISKGPDFGSWKASCCPQQSCYFRC